MIENKVEAHNKSVSVAHKKASVSMLEKVYNRGVGAYKTNPSSVRPNVSSPEQWAAARVEFLPYALKNERFRGGAHDRDLFPKGHKLRTDSEEEKKMENQETELREQYGENVERRTIEVRAAESDSMIPGRLRRPLQ